MYVQNGYMDLKSYLLKENKLPSHFALEAGVEPSILSRLFSGQTKELKIDTVRKIVKATNGAVTVKDLRPDLADIIEGTL